LLIRLSGNAKTYAERLFEYPDIGALDPADARRALVKPAAQANVEFDDEAITAVIHETQGYPYFLQEWGYQAWNTAPVSPITKDDIARSSEAAIGRLDRNFFRSRYERLSEPQKAYLDAMARCGPGPHRTGDIARAMGKSSQQMGPTREALIAGRRRTGNDPPAQAPALRQLLAGEPGDDPRGGVERRQDDLGLPPRPCPRRRSRDSRSRTLA